jgi:hypothetical protein
MSEQGPLARPVVSQQPSHRVECPRPRSNQGRTSANFIVAGGAVIHKLTRPGCAGTSRSLMNNCETDIRMPGTGSLRRSSAPARKKAIVGKSRIGAGAVRSPRFVFFRPPSLSITRCWSGTHLEVSARKKIPDSGSIHPSKSRANQTSISPSPSL